MSTDFTLPELSVSFDASLRKLVLVFNPSEWTEDALRFFVDRLTRYPPVEFTTRPINYLDQPIMTPALFDEYNQRAVDLFKVLFGTGFIVRTAGGRWGLAR